MELNKDFREFIALLNEHNVKYLVIGGYAVNLHGYPRYTKDIDVWVKPGQKNIEKLINVISDFGFGSLGLDKNDFKDPDDIIQLGRAPYRIDLLTAVAGVDFETCFKRKSKITLDNIRVNFLGLQDLIKAKKATGRLQDLADAEQLTRIQKEG